MTLKDLKDRCADAKITYQYGMVEEGTKPPYLVGIVSDSNNFIADNKVYKKIDSVELYYTYKVKDTDIEDTIENVILEDVVWRKGDENFYKDDEVWQVVYYFNI